MIQIKRVIFNKLRQIYNVTLFLFMHVFIYLLIFFLSEIIRIFFRSPPPNTTLVWAQSITCSLMHSEVMVDNFRASTVYIRKLCVMYKLIVQICKCNCNNHMESYFEVAYDNYNIIYKRSLLLLFSYKYLTENANLRIKCGTLYPWLIKE